MAPRKGRRGETAALLNLYAVAVLFPLELLIMYIMHRRNTKDPVYEQENVGAVDLTPWKYRHVASVIVLICVVGVYLIFSPFGIAAW